MSEIYRQAFQILEEAEAEENLQNIVNSILKKGYAETLIEIIKKELQG